MDLYIYLKYKNTRNKKMKKIKKNHYLRGGGMCQRENVVCWPSKLTSGHHMRKCDCLD